MSWSVSAKGKVSEVRASLSRQFETSGPCVEPEETTRQSAAKLIDEALGLMNPEKEVYVTGCGSQNFDYSVTPAVPTTSSLSIKIEPQG